MALMPSLQSLCALQFWRLSRFWRVLFQQRCALGMFYGTSQAQDREIGCIRPRLVRRGFLMRLGVVCLADFAVKNTTFKRRLLAMLYGDIIYKYKCAQLFKAISKLWESCCHICVIGYGYNKYNMFDSALHKAKVYKQQGNTFFISKDYEKALQHYTLSINAFPLMQVYSNRAMTYINLQKYQQALEDCECALKMDKTHLKTILRKAKCLIYLLRIDQATNFLDISLKEENKQSSKELTQLANKIKERINNYQYYRKKKEHTQARQFLNECYSMMKNNTVIIVSIIQCQARINKAESMKLLNSISTTVDQTCFIYWFLRTIIQLSFGFKDRAKTYLKQTLRYFTTKPLKQIEKKLLISFTKEQLLQLLENISTCQKLIKESFSLMRQERYKQVIKKLNIVLDADTISSEQRVNLLFMRSRCFKLTKQKPKQLNDLNKLLRIQLNHVQALQARMQLYENEKKYQLALRDAENLHTITNKHNNTVQKFTNFVNSKQQEKLDYYETLAIDRTATQDDIKKAYRQLAIIYHPDKNRGLNEQQQKFAKEKFKQIKKAQVCLIDPQKRQLYDHHNCDPQEFIQQKLRKSDFSDIFSSFGAFGGTFESFFNSSQAGIFRPGSSNDRNNFQGFFPSGFSFKFTPNGFPF